MVPPNLTDEMRQAMAAHPDCPIQVLDATTQRAYFLVPAEKYEKVQSLIYDDSEPNPSEFLPFFQKAAADYLDAPGMEAYDDYDRHRPK